MIPNYLRSDPQKYSVANLIVHQIDWDLEDIHCPEIERGTHPDIYFVESVKRWYYFYKESDSKGYIIGNDLDGISSHWQKHLQVTSEGILQHREDYFEILDRTNALDTSELLGLRKLREIMEIPLERASDIQHLDINDYVIEHNHVIALAIDFQTEAEAEDVFECILHFPHIRILSLYGFTRWVLSVDLSPLSQLESFTVSNHNKNRSGALEEIPPWFAKFHRLKNLTIRQSNISVLPVSFVTLSNLESLTINNSYLKSLPLNLGQLTNLTTLSLSFNQLVSIPESLGQLYNLTTLDLRGNELTSLPPSLGKLGRLLDLNIARNRLSEFPPSFEGLTSLNKIDMSFNQIRTLPPFWLISSSPLKIQASNNLLHQFPEIVSSSPSNQLFNFLYNFLPNYYEESWQCEICGAEFVFTQSFRQDRKCRYCSTRNTAIIEINENFSEETLQGLLDFSQSIRKLTIKGFQIKKVFNIISSLPYLASLVLMGQNLTYLPNLFNKITHVKQIIIQMKNLTHLPESLFQLKELRALTICSDYLTVFPELKPSWDTLEVLTLKCPRLKRIPIFFSHCHHLTKINLTFTNSKVEIPWEIFRMPSILEINLPKGYISSKPDAFKKKLNEYYQIWNSKLKQ